MSKSQFGERIPTLSQLITLLPAILDARMEVRMNTVHGKRFVIFHENQIYREALEKASWDLNSAGIRIYHEAIEMFEQKVGLLTLHISPE